MKLCALPDPDAGVPPTATGDPACAPAETVRIEPPGLNGKTIVVVDNDKFAIDAMRAVPNGWGCHLVGAASWQEAVERLTADALVPDLIVADYHLDHEIYGTDVITTLRHRYGNKLPALVVSGDRSVQLRASLKASGHAFLAKPVSPARLRAMMSYLVNPPTDD